MTTLAQNLFILVISLALIFLVLGTLAYAAIVAAPWMPLRRRDISRVLTLANIRSGEKLYDLGSGDGRIVIAAAKDFQAQSTGFEIAFLPFLYSFVKIKMLGMGKFARVHFKNFFRADLGNADVVITFLMPKAMKKLKQKFETELKPGTRVITCAWSIPGWKPDLVDKPNSQEISMYVYTVK